MSVLARNKRKQVAIVFTNFSTRLGAAKQGLVNTHHRRSIVYHHNGLFRVCDLGHRCAIALCCGYAQIRILSASFAVDYGSYCDIESTSRSS